MIFCKLDILKIGVLLEVVVNEIVIELYLFYNIDVDSDEMVFWL